MGLSEEHKQKMAEGRARAALARKQAAALKPADLPPGKDRNEARAIVHDHLEERIERENADVGMEAVDRSKLERRDNEILRHIDAEGNIGVQNAQPGFNYARLPVADQYRESGARANIRAMHEEAKRYGYKPVQGDDPEDSNMRGDDAASGTSLRGVADTILYKQRLEDKERMDQITANRAARAGAVEDNSVLYAQQRLSGAGMPNTFHAIGGDFSKDAHLARRFSADEGRPVTMMKTDFTEGDLRRGSMRGPAGDVLQPGFERRR